MRLARERANASRCSKTLPAFLSMRRTLYPTARHPLLFDSSAHVLKAMIKPNREGMVCLKSKASAPGMAQPIRRDAGILCDQAVLS